MKGERAFHIIYLNIFDNIVLDIIYIYIYKV